MSATPGTSITLCPHGPLLVRGDFELLDAMGLTVDPRRGTVALCRCGGSLIKPFCDGTHKLLEFQAPDPTAALTPNIDDHPRSPTQENTPMNNTPENRPTADETAEREAAQAADHVSDPSLNTEPGHDWTDEGGATVDGPALDAQSADDSGT